MAGSTAIIDITSEELLNDWPKHFQSNGLVPGAFRIHKSALKRFPFWEEQQEHHPLTAECLTPMRPVDYCNFLPKARGRSTNALNGHLSSSRVWYIVAAGASLIAQMVMHKPRSTSSRSSLLECTGESCEMEPPLGHTPPDTTGICTKPSVKQPSVRVELVQQNTYFG